MRKIRRENNNERGVGETKKNNRKENGK